MTATPVNPDNDRPTVRLLDEAGGPLGLVSQREAARLLRTGQADLVLATPPGVRLTVPTAEYEEEAARGQFLHARRGRLYGNVTFQGPGGEEMFHGDAEKALWYLNRGLVEVVGTDPPVLRFRFAPGGPGHAGDAFYLGGKEDRCVVCGATQGLNRHHVVPSVYRRHLPREMKEHSHHDVVLLCLECHERYEREADDLKAELGRECGVPPHGLRGETDRARKRATQFAATLLRDRGRIPAARRDEMLRAVGAWLKKWPIDDADLATVASAGLGGEQGAVEHGPQVVAAAGDLQAFVRRWRAHFLRVMGPRHLPPLWDVDRPAGRPSPGEPGA